MYSLAGSGLSAGEPHSDASLAEALEVVLPMVLGRLKTPITPGELLLLESLKVLLWAFGPGVRPRKGGQAAGTRGPRMVDAHTLEYPADPSVP